MYRACGAAPDVAELMLIPVDNCRVTPERLLDHVQDARIQLAEFEYSKTTDGRFVWRREPFKMQLRPAKPAGRA